MPICLLRLATLTMACCVWLPDLDPNNLLYRPRGERGEGGGKAPIGANVAAVQAGARIDWGHLKGVVCTAKEQKGRSCSRHAVRSAPDTAHADAHTLEA